MTRNIVILTGEAGAGKTTIAKYLCEHHAMTRVRFAEPLKAMTAALGFSQHEIEDKIAREQPHHKLTLEYAHDLIQNLGDALEALDPSLQEVEDEHKPLDNFNAWSLAYVAASFVSVVMRCCTEGGVQGNTVRRLMQMIGTEWGRNMIDKDLWVKAWLWRVNDLSENAVVVVDDCRFPNEQDAAKGMGNAVTVRLVREGAGLTGEAKAHESEQHYLPPDIVVLNNGLVATAGETILNRRPELRREQEAA